MTTQIMDSFTGGVVGVDNIAEVADLGDIDIGRLEALDEISGIGSPALTKRLRDLRTRRAELRRRLKSLKSRLVAARRAATERQRRETARLTRLVQQEEAAIKRLRAQIAAVIAQLRRFGIRV